MKNCTIKRSNDRYYVYELISEVDPITGKRKQKLGESLGRLEQVLDQDPLFLKKYQQMREKQHRKPAQVCVSFNTKPEWNYTIKRSRGRAYVYEAKMVYDPQTGKRKQLLGASLGRLDDVLAAYPDFISTFMPKSNFVPSLQPEDKSVTPEVLEQDDHSSTASTPSNASATSAASAASSAGSDPTTPATSKRHSKVRAMSLAKLRVILSADKPPIQPKFLGKAQVRRKVSLIKPEEDVSYAQPQTQALAEAQSQAQTQAQSHTAAKLCSSQLGLVAPVSTLGLDCSILDTSSSHVSGSNAPEE